MFSTLKKLIVVSLLVIIPIVSVSAQSTSFQDKAANLGNFLLLQFDPTDILEDFKADLLLNDNTCKQLDTFQVLSSQGNIVDELLLNFESINQAERESLIFTYQNLEIENQFLNHIDILIENGFLQGQSSHILKIKADLPADIQPNVDSLYPSLSTKYESRIRKPNPSKSGQFIEGDYLNCPSSWSSVKERTYKINDELEKISKEWDALKEAYRKLESATSDAVSPASLKSIFIDQPIEATVKSFEGTIQNLNREVQKNKKEFEQITTKPIDTYQQILKENQALIGNRNDIAGLLLSNKDITQITESITERSQIRALLDSKVQSYSANQITAQHFDYGLQANLNLVYKTPLLISYNKQVFKETNQEGILKYSKQVYDRQCVVNP